MIYLASPYSHPDQAVERLRFEAVCQAAATLMRHGLSIFSPIAHSHPIARFGLPTDWAFWEHYNRDFLARDEDLFRVAPLGRATVNYGWSASMDLQLVTGYDPFNYRPDPESPWPAHYVEGIYIYLERDSFVRYEFDEWDFLAAWEGPAAGIEPYTKGKKWLLVSYGPDRLYSITVVGAWDIRAIYDATNGTISFGDIIRTGP